MHTASSPGAASTFVVTALSLLVGGELACNYPVTLPYDSDDGGSDSAAPDDDGSPSTGPTASGCDDPTTCAYDLETSCAGEPAADPTAFPACPADVCGGGGHCVPESAIPEDQLEMLSSCGGSSRCVPDSFIERGGKVTPASCLSIGEAEGRCLSTCLPAVARRAEFLPSEGCSESERCVPCYDPFDGTPSGACEVSCDAGPAMPPKPLPACCPDKGGGTCLPSQYVDSEQQDRLDDEECPTLGMQGALCVPDPILMAHLAGVPFHPVECETGLILQELGFSPDGGCLPECIPIVDSLPVAQSNCADGYKCVPCTDFNGGATGACGPQ